MIKQAEPQFSFQDFGRLLSRNKKAAGVYGFVFIFISVNLCLFLPSNLRTPAAERMVNAIQLLCFAVMGIVNVWFFYKSSFLAAFSLSKAKLAFISLLFVVILLMLFIYYYVTRNNGLIMAFASSGSFLLPFLLYQGWLEFMSIPEKTYAAWYLPAQTAGYAGMPALQSMHLQLIIARKAVDSTENTFPVTSPGKQKLGKLFERFVEDQRAAGKTAIIETRDANNQGFAWHFVESKWFGLYQRRLNPGRSLLENNLTENATIRIIRTPDEQVVQG